MTRINTIFALAGLSLVLAGFLVGATYYPSMPVPEIPYTTVPTPFGTARVAPGHALRIAGVNDLVDNRSGASDQGWARGDKVNLKPGAQAFDLNSLMVSTEKGTYFAEHVVKSAWIICLIGLVMIGVGAGLTLTGIGATVAVPIMLIGSVVFLGGLVAMMVENINGLYLLLLVVPVIGYMVWKSKQKTATVTDAVGTVEAITAEVQDLAAHATAANWPIVQAQINALKTQLGL